MRIVINVYASKHLTKIFEYFICIIYNVHIVIYALGNIEITNVFVIVLKSKTTCKFYALSNYINILFSEDKYS
jgi:hypothetical protein